MIRVERVRVADAAGPNRIAAKLVTSMYIGDRFEHLFELGHARLRAYGESPLAADSMHFVELPRDAVWIFRANA